MFRLFVLALCCAAAIGELNVREIPQPPTHAGIPRQSRIINGHDANDREYPYIVSLNYVGDGHACGASVINNNWVLTAAHCCLTGNALEVLAGSIYLSHGATRYDIEKYIVHGDYDPNNNWRNDICLIRTRNAIQYNENVQPVRLPPRDQNINSGDPVKIIGWGVDQNGNGPDRLQVLDNYQGLSNPDCRARTNLDLYDGQICALGGQNQGVCSGDSGGPLTFNGVQIGVTSFVFLPCGGTGLPDVYTRVSWYVDWINQVINS